MSRFDRYWIGIVLGLILPLAFAYAYIDTMHLWQPLMGGRINAGGIMGKLCLLSVFPDLALIFLFYTTDTWQLSKGVLIGAMPYMLLSIYFLA